VDLHCEYICILSSPVWLILFLPLELCLLVDGIPVQPVSAFVNGSLHLVRCRLRLPLRHTLTKSSGSRSRSYPVHPFRFLLLGPCHHFAAVQYHRKGIHQAHRRFLSPRPCETNFLSHSSISGCYCRPTCRAHSCRSPSASEQDQLVAFERQR
jgi:hypothetical protein